MKWGAARVGPGRRFRAGRTAARRPRGGCARRRAARRRGAPAASAASGIAPPTKIPAAGGRAARQAAPRAAQRRGAAQQLGALHLTFTGTVAPACMKAEDEPVAVVMRIAMGVVPGEGAAGGVKVRGSVDLDRAQGEAAPHPCRLREPPRRANPATPPSPLPSHPAAHARRAPRSRPPGWRRA
jgi:hypothetical protein